MVYWLSIKENHPHGQNSAHIAGLQNHLQGERTVTEEHGQIADTDDELVRTAFHIDDGRDYTQRIIHRMKRNFYIHEGVCPPLPPAPQVAGVKLTPVKKTKKRRKLRNKEQESE
ncbi:hypothetical protein GPY37_22220 [Photorhabdus kayaii]|uniref:hypothetical protein n=1 Tax=Photorhabdus TaxID=29487 RepID=UPI001314452B|nr:MULTISPECIES: hypothetical protein [Photorhabdus]MDB6366702.1 hypothetical protein [Photorhabdus bodei]NDL14290.1 hypothetical protein [Photorhabdus kayaii]